MSKVKNAAARQVIYRCCASHPAGAARRENRDHTKAEAAKAVDRARAARGITAEEYNEAKRYLQYCPDEFTFRSDSA